MSLALRTLAFLIALIAAPAAQGQTVAWTDTGAATAWYTATNWTPNTSSAAWLTTNVAQFNNTGTATTAGINMGTSSLSIGAIEVSSLRTRALTIGNSSTTTGTLTLHGTTVDSINNVILRNASGSLLTLQNNETGSGKTMNIVLANTTTNVVLLEGAGGIAISSNISGAGRSLTVQGGGSGTLVLSGANTYDGGTTISAGAVRFDTRASMPATGNVSVIGGTLGVTVASTGTTWGGGTGNAGIAGLTNGLGGQAGSTVSFTGNSNLLLNVTGATTESNVISNGGATNLSLTKQGTATLTLSGNNTYTGGTTLTAGTLAINSATAIGTGAFNIAGGTLDNSSSGAITLSTNNATNINGNFTFTGTQALNLGTGAATLTGNRTITVTGNILTLGGGIGQDVAGRSLTKAGGGRLQLTGASTYTGATSITAGTIELGNGGTTGSLNTASAISIATGGLLRITQSDTVTQGTDFSGSAITGAGGITQSGTGTTILNALNTYTGTTSVTRGTLTLSGGNATSGNIWVSNDPSNFDSTLNITGGTYNVTGANVFRLGQTNTAPVTATVNHSAGNVSFSSNASAMLLIGSTSGTTPPATTGIYNLSGGSISIIPATGEFGIMMGVNTNATGTFNLSGTGVLNMTNTSRGDSLGDGKLLLGRVDSASTTVTSNFNQTGGTANVGILSIGGNAAAGVTTGTQTLNLTGGTFSANVISRLAAGNNNVSIINIGGTADVTLPAFPTARGTDATATINFDGGVLRNLVASPTFMGGLTNANILTGGAKFNTGNGNATITQVLAGSGAGGLTKEGANTLTLSGANTYTGPTNVNGGTLALAATGSLANSSAIILNGTSTYDVSAVSAYALSGTQTIRGTGTVIGSLTVANGTTIRGGTTATPNGTLNTAAVTIIGGPTTTGATFAVDLNNNPNPDITVGSNSRIAAGANAFNFDVTSGKFNINLLNDSSLTHGTSYTIVLATGTNFQRNGAGSPIFTSADFNLTGSWAAYTGLNLFEDTVNNRLNLSFTPVPEPGSILAVGFMGAFAFARYRRKNRLQA
ncbi:MAG: beta strand repeat-containing protein [Fimbriiglobus sp.]